MIITENKKYDNVMKNMKNFVNEGCAMENQY